MFFFLLLFPWFLQSHWLIMNKQTLSSGTSLANGSSQQLHLNSMLTSISFEFVMMRMRRAFNWTFMRINCKCHVCFCCCYFFFICIQFETNAWDTACLTQFSWFKWNILKKRGALFEVFALQSVQQWVQFDITETVRIEIHQQNDYFVFLFYSTISHSSIPVDISIMFIAEWIQKIIGAWVVDLFCILSSMFFNYFSIRYFFITRKFIKFIGL